VLADVVGYLRCPLCAAPLTLVPGRLTCPARHAFDVARQGYVSLLAAPVAGAAGDTAAMVQARERFLAGGHFAPLAAALAEAASAGVPVPVPGPASPHPASPHPASPHAAAADDPPPCVLDLGAGTGYYLAAVLDRLPGWAGIALDVSRYALRRAARAHPRIGAVAADAWRPLPVRDDAAGLALSVFAPRNPAELRRVLRPGGSLLVLTPTPRHLRELVRKLDLLTVDARKPERLAEQLGGHFALMEQRDVDLTLRLDHEQVEVLAGMGPSAWHTDRDRLRRRVAGLPPRVEVSASVTLARYR
jgi:23S rRNA (guanine745-N1)-methyltransferase